MKTMESVASSSPTIIEIASSMVDYVTNEKHPYYARVELDARISSTTSFDEVFFSHLGFKIRPKGKNHARHIDNGYAMIIPIDVACAAMFKTGPFCVYLENIGDGCTRVNIRMNHGMNYCKIIIIQDKFQMNNTRQLDEFIKHEDIYYASFVTNSLQAVRIEEAVSS